MQLDNVKTIILMSDIDDETCAAVISSILTEQYNPKTELIRLFINTQGGQLTAAFALIEVMRASRIPVETVAIGQCISAGLMIFLAGTPGHRFVTPTCSSMSHTYSTDYGGNHWDIKTYQKELNNTQRRIYNLYKKCTTATKEEIEEFLIGRGDNWLTPNELIKFGIADKIIDMKFSEPTFPEEEPTEEVIYLTEEEVKLINNNIDDKEQL